MEGELAHEHDVNVRPVVLCGGSGTRLWPLSRSGFPKQFLCLTDKESLFQLAMQRHRRIGGASLKVSDPFVVCNEEHRFLALEQMREVKCGDARFLLEPQGRNTAPALTLAALAAMEDGDDPILVVTPADQVISNDESFIESIRLAIRTAADGNIVMLGVAANMPQTGYGYIKIDRPDGAQGNTTTIFDVECFVEKPSLSVAQKYIDDGNYYWNAGIFVLRASTWLSALRNFRPDIADSTRIAWEARCRDPHVPQNFVRPGAVEFTSIPAESIDYAVIERCPGSSFSIKMVQLDAGWNDVGAWDAVWEVASKDSAGNAYVGDVLAIDNRNTLVHATSRLVTLIGTEDLVVVETPDAILVADRRRGQEVKKLVEQLSSSGREEQSLHRKVHRPWGWYDSIDMGHRFKVKRIQVNPKASLSLQKHHHRAEHWIVVQGTAEIVCGDKTLLLTENESTFIPLGKVHRLSNPGSIPLEIIEVQSGSYLGEDDIVRFDDTYGRVG